MQKRLKREREKAADADTSTDASNLDVDHQLEEMLAFMARNDRMQPASCDARPSGPRVSETQDPRADSP
jgi:hypothetical protein